MSDETYEPLISERRCDTCRWSFGDGTCQYGYKSGYNEKGEQECQNYDEKQGGDSSDH